MLDNVSEFKKKYDGFREAMDYMNKHVATLKKDPERWQIILLNFKNKYEIPLDKAWEILNEEEQKKFFTLYTFRRESAEDEMERFKKTAEFFAGGKIVGFKNK